MLKGFLSKIILIALDNSEILVGSIIREKSPDTSGIDDLNEVIDGVPQIPASKGGNPKPSKNEGYNNNLDKL